MFKTHGDIGYPNISPCAVCEGAVGMMRQGNTINCFMLLHCFLNF